MTICTSLEAYLSGRLSDAEARGFEAHAASCAACGKAITRRQAIERAAKVLQRNQATRGASILPVTPAMDADRAMGAAPPTYPAPRRAGPRWPLVAGIVAVAAGLAVWGLRRSERELSGDAGAPTSVAQRAAEAARSPGASMAATLPSAAAPAPTTATPVPADAAPTAVMPGPAPAAPASPAIAATAAHPPAPRPRAEAPATRSSEDEMLGPDTDFATLERIGKSGRCWRAIDALAARVTKDDADAASWALLARCQARRKRWEHAVAAYSKAIAHADPADMASLRREAETARAALEASPPPQQDGEPAPAP